MLMTLDINGMTVAAHTHQWHDSIQEGTADVEVEGARVRVHFTCGEPKSGNFNPFYYGYIIENDLALIPNDSGLA
jgi:hypothetical protein